jgi:hypothetical protein
MSHTEIEMEKVKHIVGYSGGAASAVVAKIVKDKYPDDTILLFHDTMTEPEDNKRFREEFASFIDAEIIDKSDGRNIWQVFEDEGYLGNGRNTMCSRILKQELSLEYLKKSQPAILYIGFTMEEHMRAQRVTARYMKHGIEVKFPLIEQKITKEECHHRIENCWNIRTPKNYEWAEHANCIPCIKGKKAYWGLIYMFEREAWQVASDYEEKFGQTIFTEAGSLKDEIGNCLRLANKYLEKRKAEKDQISLFDFPCECAV